MPLLLKVQAHHLLAWPTSLLSPIGTPPSHTPSLSFWHQRVQGDSCCLPSRSQLCGAPQVAKRSPLTLASLHAARPPANF
eukprot:6214642-Pleurochrysis_carterae.AAC.2